MMFTVFSKDNCPYCEKAKMLIINKGHEYAESKLGVDYDREDLMRMFPDARTFPIVLQMNAEGSERIGGFDDLEKFLATQEMSI